jgi:4-amino-4-deoxy-L-arabinose transferase-like glycosyltransferase
VIVAFTWFGILIAQDPDRLGYFLGYEVYDRVFTAAHDRNAQWYGGFEIYLPVFVVGALPWWPLAIAAGGGPRSSWAALRSRLRSRDRTWLLLAAWLFLPLLVFMLARSRLQLYVLPLFVPLSIVLARPLARWAWLTRRKLGWLATVTAVALIAFKGSLAHFPIDRDAREMARALVQVLGPHQVEEIAFVGMRPFYGLRVYLDVRIESIGFGEYENPYSRYVAAEDLCSELAQPENAAYALKERRSTTFLEAAARCSDVTMQSIGEFEADGNRIVLYRALPAAPAVTAGSP